jgi:2-C-methyl-D-erythritol 4-phosphate cytidylyltransferase/2-C-methyl-D-erythritol 2,4-cyclodiphosphate synthase
VRVVLGAGQLDHYERATSGLPLLPPIEGGATRQDSVRLGLESLEASAPDLVLIHDAARPLLSAALVDRVLDALGTAEAALPVLPVTDTLKRIDAGGLAASGPDRGGLARAQTPQGFRLGAILRAHRAVHAAGASYTDDAAVAEAAGLAVACVPGEERNLKVTVPDDLTLAGLLLAGAPRAYRTGLGFDVHQFADDRPMVLCGVHIPTARGCSAIQTPTPPCTPSPTPCSARSGPATSASTSHPPIRGGATPTARCSWSTRSASWRSAAGGSRTRTW